VQPLTLKIHEWNIQLWQRSCCILSSIIATTQNDNDDDHDNKKEFPECSSTIATVCLESLGELKNPEKIESSRWPFPPSGVDV
jgi:hypothetical protein